MSSGRDEYRTPPGLFKSLRGKLADKDAVMAAARTKWGGDIGDDNEADALWIAEVMRRRVAADGGHG